MKNTDYVNEHRRKVVHAIGNKAMLSRKNVTLKKGHVKKFSSKYIGPFNILEKHAKGKAYKLQFSSVYAQLHPLFHVPLLKTYAENKIGKYSPTPSSYETANSEFEIDKIFNHRINKGNLQFLLKFKAYEDTESAWVESNNLPNANNLLRLYEKNRK